MKNVGTESSKTYQDKLDNGFFKKYMSGIGIELGYKGYTNTETLLETSLGIDLDTPNYDGKHIPVGDNTQDYFYSSHVLEHIEDYKIAIKEWHRVIKPGGYIITVVPHRDLYEKKLELPSQFNGSHLRFYKTSDLVREFEESLPVNSFRVRHLRDNDLNHDYFAPSNIHASWLYEIEMVVQKL